MQVIKPPTKTYAGPPSLFLAGSIEMGTAEDWQKQVEAALADTDITIFNPRRDDWDSSWEQDINNRQFREQVEWELDALTHATVIALYLSPGTKSPISLLELGLFAKRGLYHGLIVCCPPGFWRKGNVDIVCWREKIPEMQSLWSLIEDIRQTFGYGPQHA